LAATRNDEELRRKETELALAKERAERDKQERDNLQKLKMELESEKRKVEEQLEAERALGLEKDRLLERSKKQEADLADDVVALQLDLETVDGQLDAAMKLQKETEEKRRELQVKYDEAISSLKDLESSQVSWRQREQDLLSSVQKAEKDLNELSISRQELQKTSKELQQKLVEKEEDILRLRERMDMAMKDLEGKLSSETKTR
jgi:myosin protein heavy chain